MEPDDLTQHCFRCKGLVVVDPSTFKVLSPLLYRAANTLDLLRGDAYDGVPELMTDLKAMAILLDMIPDDR